MKFQFFKVPQTSMTPSEKTVIELLVEIRNSDYKPAMVNRLTMEHLLQINNLVTKLGAKILEANSRDAIAYNEARINFSRVIKELPENKFVLSSYAAQLLQYYTIVSADEFSPDQGVVEFNDFLYEHRASFGNTYKNLFIAEYKLIKIYNSLCDLIEMHEGTLAPIPAASKEKLISTIISELEKLKKQMDQWILDAPDHTFIHYLSFAYYYCYAKTLELHFLENQKMMSEEEKATASDTQHAALKFAKDALKDVENLKNNSKFPGTEFSLGQDLLGKLPIKDFDTIKLHLSELIESSNSMR